MSILNRLFRSEPAGAAGGMEQRTLTSSYFVPPPSQGFLADYVGANRAMSSMTVYGCVRLLADTIASLPWKAYRRDSKGIPVELPNQPVIVRTPTPGFDLYQWKWAMVAGMALRGNSFHLVTGRDNQGYPTGLMPLHPDAVFLERRPDLLKWYDPIYRVLGEIVPSADLVHIRRFTMPGEPWGLSPIKQAAQAIGMSLSAEEYGYRYFREAANPTGVLSTDQNLDELSIERQQKQWISSHQGRRLPAILTGGLKWQNLSISPEESQFLETRQFQRSEIMMLFGIPPHLLGDQTKSTSWGCLPGDSLVATTSGPVPIEDVQVGDEVFSFDGQKMVTGKVTGWRMTGHKPVLTVKTSGRELRLTANHRVPVRRYFGLADGRKMGQCGWETVEVSAGDIRKGDYVIVPHGMGDGDRRMSPDGVELTVGMMEFAGLYLGDGSRDKGRVEIAHAVDEKHMGHYRSVIESEFGANPYTDKHGRRTRFSSPSAIRLIESGFTGSALTKRIPSWVFRLAPDLQLALLRGYLDSDGAVTKGGVINYSSAHRMLLEDARQLCIQLGVPVGRVIVGRRSGPMTIDGRTYMAQTKYQLQLAVGRFNSLIGSHNPDKARRFQVTNHQRPGRYEPGWTGKDGAKPAPLDGWDLQGAVLHKVVSVETGDIKIPVYDIEVEGPAHFVADGVVVHNSGISEQNIGFVTHTLRPWTSCIESVISSLLPRGQFIRFDFSAMLRGDVGARYQAYESALHASWMSPNEIRAHEELEPIEGGDTYLQPVTMAPLGFVPHSGPGTEGGAPDKPSMPEPPADKAKKLPSKTVSGGENTGVPGDSK